MRKNLEVIYQIPLSNLVKLQAAFSEVHFDHITSDGFESFMENESSFNEALQAGVKKAHYQAILKRNDYCEFVNTRLELFDSFHKSLYPELENLESFAFRGYYGAKHDDRHIPYNEQLMYVMSNGGHSLWSDGVGFITPQAGDVVRLNTHAEHALYPCPNKPAAACAKTPLMFYAVCYKV